MTRLQDPAFLAVVVVLVPLAALAWWARRRRVRVAVAWGDPAVAAALAGVRRPARFAVPALVAVSVLLAAVALAGPEQQVLDRDRVATAVLVLDVSRSMESVDVAPSRLDAAQAAAVTFLDGLAPYVRVGVVRFAGTAETLVSPTLDRDEVRAAVTTLRTADATAIGDALRAGLAPAEIAASVAADGTLDAPARGPVTVVLLSDGANTAGSDPLDAAEVAASLGVVVHTVALGTPTGTVDLVDPATGAPVSVVVPPDTETLAAIAEATGGTFSDVADADTLTRVYASLAADVVEVRTWVPRWRGFAAAALTSGLAAVAVATVRRRIP